MDSELKELVSETLREKQDSYVIQELFRQFPTKTQLVNVSEQQLRNIKGIGIGKARQLLALLKFSKIMAAPAVDLNTIQKPKDVYDYLQPELRYQTKEHFICLFLNSKNRLIFKETISIGSLNSAIVHPREVFKEAIRHCSASIICSHNHPSGDATPSSEDINITKRLVSAGEIIGIEVLDHVIIGDNQFYSLKEHGYI
ncbi:DNA repair protein RadC [Paenibacillus sp. LBL]|uniref:RadC family protein n=1 Tax=Paenibacillus sp. LBL TaxID=2940563 RepID=UPI002476680D|nr:DNA repair protein RadC [Paenibacillus sp. LBL]MDH6671230.1 DNA repair protein RadC [Paenibacillus sp. LBL]